MDTEVPGQEQYPQYGGTKKFLATTAFKTLSYIRCTLLQYFYSCM